MSEGPPPSSLLRILDRAAAFGLGSEAARPVRDLSEALTFVHDQIAATLLPRLLEFHADGAHILTCAVSGRRLMRFTPAAGAETVLDGLADRDGHGAALEALARTLAPCAAGAVLRVVVRDWDDPSSYDAGGLSCEQFADWLGMDAEAEATTGWDNIQTAKGNGILVAARLDDDDLTPLIGGDAGVGDLANLLEDILPDLENLPEWEADGMPGLFAFGGLGPEGADLVILQDCETLIVAFVRSDRIAALVQAWHAGPRRQRRA